MTKQDYKERALRHLYEFGYIGLNDRASMKDETFEEVRETALLNLSMAQDFVSHLEALECEWEALGDKS